VGHVAANSKVSFALELKLRDAAGAASVARAVSSPGNALYRHYLTAAKWESRYSPTANAVAQARAWLRQEGFKLGAVSKDRMTVSASGSAALVERAFGTKLDNYRVAGETVRLASTALSIPASLARIVIGAIGINEIPATTNLSPTPRSTVTSGRTSQPDQPIPPPAGFRNAMPCSTYYGQKLDTKNPAFGHHYASKLPYQVCGYVPGQMRSLYGVAAGVAKGDNGKGVTVAIIDAYQSPTLLADATKYFKNEDPSHPLAASQFTSVALGAPANEGLCAASGWFSEQSLDVEAVHSMAPGANILYVGGVDCLDPELLAALQAVIDSGAAQVITDSWGDLAGDFLVDAATRSAYDNTFLMAAGTGISVLFSSGDSGDDYTTVGFTSADYPPSSPWVTAVGGTSAEISKPGTRISELGWSTGKAELCTGDIANKVTGCTSKTLNTWLPLAYDYGGGGGTSIQYLQPWYQAKVVPIALSERNSPWVGPVPTRVIPDISMDADPTTGFLFGLTQTFGTKVAYGQYRIGGTSLASPLLAGVIADADQEAGVAVGFLNPTLYDVDLTDPSVFYDVVPGGLQAMVRVDFLNGLDSSGGLVTSVRTLDEQGTETYCDATGNCESRPVTLTPAKGFDSMTGIGTVADGFVGALAKF